MRRATWILWLMLALLPLRGWAVAGMGLPQLPAPVAMAEAGESHAMPPCHQAVDEAGTQAGITCQVCDACHSALALPPSVVWDAAASLAAQPSASVQRDTGRAAIGGLERPPRSLLA